MNIEIRLEKLENSRKVIEMLRGHGEFGRRNFNQLADFFGCGYTFDSLERLGIIKWTGHNESFMIKDYWGDTVECFRCFYVIDENFDLDKFKENLLNDYRETLKERLEKIDEKINELEEKRAEILYFL